MDCSFILGSIACIEQLFSRDGDVYSVNRRQITSLMFGSLMFLKVNRRFWDQSLVSQAIREAKKSAAKDQLEKQLKKGYLVMRIKILQHIISEARILEIVFLSFVKNLLHCILNLVLQY